MYSMMPVENLANAFELISCFFTLLAVVASYLFTMRF